MAGHSKWHNIKIKKEKVDAKKGKIFTRVSKEIMLAVKEGGPDADANYRLATAIQKAKDVNMPNSNIKRAIDKASGDASGSGLEEAVYEGYGPHGVAVLIETATDNKNRTVPELRAIFSKQGGSLGESGCVSWMFEKKGLITVPADRDEEEMLDLALEAGAEDMTLEDGFFNITTEFSQLYQVKKALQDKKAVIESSEIIMIPTNEVKLDKEQAAAVLKMMDAFEENDDVQNVYANFDIPDEVMAELESASK